MEIVAKAIDLHATNYTFDRLHRDSADATFAEVLLDFSNDIERFGSVEALAGDTHCMVNLRKLTRFELKVEYRSDDLCNVPNVIAIHSHIHFRHSGRKPACFKIDFDDRWLLTIYLVLRIEGNVAGFINVPHRGEFFSFQSPRLRKVSDQGVVLSAGRLSAANSTCPERPRTSDRGRRTIALV
jgi:hypothetical protein